VEFRADEVCSFISVAVADGVIMPVRGVLHISGLVAMLIPPRVGGLCACPTLWRSLGTPRPANRLLKVNPRCCFPLEV
jgi:hypothetical protein